MVQGWPFRWMAMTLALGLGVILPCSTRLLAGDDLPALAAPGQTESIPAPAPADRILLRYKFSVGQTARYEVTHEMQITTIFNDATEIASNKSQSRRRYMVVEAHDDGSGDLELTIDWVRMTASFGNGVRQTEPIEFQSDDPARHPEKFRHILDTVGKPRATIRFTSAGRPIDLDSKELTERTASSAAVPGSDASPESYLLVFPEQGVAPGECWVERFEIVARNSDNLPLRITMRRQYKLAAVINGQATIEFQTAVLTPKEDPAIQAQLMQRETAGKVVFDVERGRIVSREVAVDRTVLYPFGPKSSLHAVSKYSERLLTDAVADVREGNAPEKQASVE